MKNKLLCILLILVLLLCACSKSPTEELYNNEVTEELYNYEVTEEPFESMEVLHSYNTYKTHSTEQELFDAAEMVFIGMPLDTFTDGEVHYYDLNANEVDKDSDQIFYYMTVRDIKVLEMIKGDSTLKTVAVADEAAVKEFKDGTKKIVGLPSDCSISKKNVKYVYYLMPALPDSMDFYFCIYDGGLVNIDGLDQKVNNSNWKLKETQARFSAQFEKYDRSLELSNK